MVGAVGELDHRVHDRLRVHDDLDPVVVDPEQLVGLDDLEALVHQGRGVHGDLRPHRPRRMGQGVVDGRPWASSAAERPRNGPPLAVSTMRARRSTPLSGRARRHWWTAQCSESTGTISAPGVARARCTTGPAAISDSLLASASRRPASRAARVTSRPAKPDHAVDDDIGLAGQVRQGLRPGANLVPPGRRPAPRRRARRRRWPPARGGLHGLGHQRRPPTWRRRGRRSGSARARP